VTRRINAEGSQKPQETRKARTGTKTPDAVQEQIDKLGKANWTAIAADGLALVNAAVAATGKETGMTRLVAALKYVATNTQIDEMLLDAVRTFLTVTISVAIGLGVPLLQVDGPNWAVCASAGLASALGVIVKFLDPQNQAYGIKRK